MQIIETSDWHFGPDSFSSMARALFSLDADLYVLNGDILDFTRYDWKSFLGSPTVRQLEEYARKRNILHLPGNHDPDAILRRVFPSWYPIGNTVEVFDGVAYTHGDLFGGYWLLLKPFAKWYPDLYRWFQKLAQTPGKYNPHDLAKFNKLAFGIQAQAIIYALRYRPIVIGHTHSPAEYIAAGHRLMTDGGRLYGGTYVQTVNGRPELRFT